jgi:hypothetical protein
VASSGSLVKYYGDNPYFTSEAEEVTVGGVVPVVLHK